MNTPNPLVPQGSLLDKGKSHFRITVLATLAVHVLLLCVLLIAGCNKKTDPAENTAIIPPPATEAPLWPTNPVPPPPPPPPLIPEVLIPPPQSIHTDIVPPPQNLTQGVGATEHTITKGETYATIGKKYGVGYKSIEAANPGLNPARLKIGDKIKIPAPKTPGAATGGAGLTAAVGESEGKTYKVKSGDNLMKIGKTYGVTPKQLRAANNLRTDQIKVGQTLKIPAKVAVAAPVDAVTPLPPVSIPAVPPPGLPPAQP